MVKKVFIDTSAWISYSLKGEKYHEEVKEFISQMIEEGVMLFTSNDVVDETVTRLVYDTNPKITRNFIDFIEENIRKKSVVQLWADEQTQAEAFLLIGKYDDQKISLTDATTVVFVTRFKIDSILSLDSDFVKLGLSVLPR